MQQSENECLQAEVHRDREQQQLGWLEVANDAKLAVWCVFKPKSICTETCRQSEQRRRQQQQRERRSGSYLSGSVAVAAAVV